MGTEQREKWKTPLQIGCIVVLVLASGLAVLVSMNWSKLSSLVHQGVMTFAELRSVQRDLQSRYKTSQVNVQFKRHSGVSGSILSVNFINPSFLQGMDPNGPEGRQKALEIAAAARDALPAASAYDNYEVIYTQRKGVGITISRTQQFMFRASNLPPPKAAAP